jgi:putative colanic acid biosynthesis acetyltransferase WcaF
LQDLSKSRLPRGFRGKNIFIVQLWWIVERIFFNLSPQVLYGWRNFLLRLFGAKIGKRVLIRSSVKITYPWKIKIGDYSWIGDDVVLYSLGEINIGKNTVISQKSYICTGSHDYSSPTFDIFSKNVEIGNEVWVATDVFVAPGVCVGDGSVVGVRSTVLHDLPPGKICFGNPARAVKDRLPVS